MFQFQNYPLNDLWAGRKYIVDIWAKPLGLAGGGSGVRWKRTGGGDRRAQTDGETRGREGASGGAGRERAREKGRAWLPLGDKWPPTDGRHIQIAPRCRCPASFYVCLPPSLRVYILHVVAWSRANDLLAKYSGKRRRVPPASFSNEYFDTGDASDVSPSPVSLCLIYRTLVEPASLATSIGRG